MGSITATPTMNMKSLGQYGAQGNGTTVAQFLGLGSRAAMAAYSVNGQTPYAFAATQPFTAGDDIWVRNPLPVAAGATSINFSAPMVTGGGASFTDASGRHYIPISSNGVADPLGRANYRSYRGMTISGGGLATGTTIVATHDFGLIVSAQPAGTLVPSGTTLTIGNDLSGVKVGMQMWAAHGLTPLCTVTAISGQTVTMSGPVVAFTCPLGNVRPGVDQLAQVCFYTPLAEATLTQNITMDTLAFLAAYYNAAYGDSVFVDPLVYCFQPHIIAAGGNVTFSGPGGQMAAFSATKNSTMIKIFPQVGATVGFHNIIWRVYGGCLPAYCEIDGSGFQDVQPNICPVAVRLTNNGGYVGGYNATTPSTSVGAYAQFKLRNIGNLRANDNSFQGFGRTIYGSCQFDLASIVLGYMNNNGAGYVWSHAEQNGYCEDLIMRDWSEDNCGAAFDGINSGIFNGYSNLIWKWSGGDNDVSRVITRVVGALECSLHDTEASFNGIQNIPGAGYVFNGCVRGSILGLQGGTGGAGNGQTCDLIQFNSATLNGNWSGTTQFRVAEISVGGFTTAINVAAGSNGNSIDTDSIINWGNTAILDNGSNTHTGGSAASTVTVTPAVSAAITAAVSAAVQALPASTTPSAAMLAAINTAVASAVAALASTTTPSQALLSAINSAVVVAVAALPASTSVNAAQQAAINAAVTSAVATAIAALPASSATTGLTPAMLAVVNAAIAAGVVHNPTYFIGGFTTAVSIPGGGNGALLKLSNNGDAGNNFNGTNYVVPTSGVYRAIGTVKLANTGAAGACPAGISVGAQVYGSTTVNFDVMQFDMTGSLRNTIRFENDVYFTAGTLISFIVYSDVGTQARSGSFSIMRIA